MIRAGSVLRFKTNLPIFYVALSPFKGERMVLVPLHPLDDQDAFTELAPNELPFFATRIYYPDFLGAILVNVEKIKEQVNPRQTIPFIVDEGPVSDEILEELQRGLLSGWGPPDVASFFRSLPSE